MRRVSAATRAVTPAAAVREALALDPAFDYREARPAGRHP